MDKEKLKKTVQEISGSLARMDGEREFIREAIKAAHDEHGINKKVLRKIATAYHKQNFMEEIATQEEFEHVYKDVIG